MRGRFAHEGVQQARFAGIGRAKHKRTDHVSHEPIFLLCVWVGGSILHTTLFVARTVFSVSRRLESLNALAASPGKDINCKNRRLVLGLSRVNMCQKPSHPAKVKSPLRFVKHPSGKSSRLLSERAVGPPSAIHGEGCSSGQTENTLASSDWDKAPS